MVSHDEVIINTSVFWSPSWLG